MYVPDSLVNDLVRAAKQRHAVENITPCSSIPSLRDCVTFISGSWCLWYNTPDGSTHIITEGDVMSEAIVKHDNDEKIAPCFYIRYQSDFRTRRVTLYEVARRIRKPIDRELAVVRIQTGEVIRVRGKFEAWGE